jgi:outer membrane protein
MMTSLTRSIATKVGRSTPRSTRMSRITRAVLTAGALGVVSPAETSAQEAPMRLTLDQALGVAAGSNPALRRATASAGLNATEMRTLWLDQLLPRVSLTLLTRFTGNLQRQAFDNFGNPIANPDAAWNYFSRTNNMVDVSWRFQGPSLFQSHRRQTLVNQDRDLAISLALTDAQVLVQKRYLDALEQRELMRAEEELIEARRIDLDVAERLFSIGVKTRVDVLNAELDIEQQTLAHQQQEASYRRALLSLRTAMGLDDRRDIDIVDETLPIFDPVDFDANDLISRALEVNPSLLRSEVAIRTAEVGLAEEKRAWWPEITAGVQVYRQAFAEGGDALFDPSITGSTESNFYVGLSFPILNGFFQQSTDQRRAAVELSNQRETDRQTRLELEETIRGALLDLDNQWTSYRLSERSNVIAEEALRLAREEYRLGTRTFEDLRASVEQEATTRRQTITSRHLFVDALLALEEAVGSSVRQMIPGAGVESGPLGMPVPDAVPDAVPDDALAPASDLTRDPARGN